MKSFTHRANIVCYVLFYAVRFWFFPKYCVGEGRRGEVDGGETSGESIQSVVSVLCVEIVLDSVFSQ